MSKAIQNTSAVTPLAEPRRKPVNVFDLLEHKGTNDKFKAVLQGAMTPDRMVRLAINAVRKTPTLGECDPYSVFGALMIAASLGLEPNTILGHAYLIPYKKRVPRKKANGSIETDSNGKWLWDDTYECQFQVGYKGFIDLMYRSGVVKEVQAEAVYQEDVFKHQFGTDTFLRYEKKMTGERGDLIGSFCYTKLTDGQAFTVLPLADIHRARAKSETYRFLSDAAKSATGKDVDKAQKKLADTPWVASEDIMALKTAIRRHSSRVKISPEFNAATLIDGTGDEGRLDLAAFKDVDVANQVARGETEPPLIEYDEAEELSTIIAPEEEREPVHVTTGATTGETRDNGEQSQRSAARTDEEDDDGGDKFDPETGELIEEEAAPAKRAAAAKPNGKSSGKLAPPEGFKFG